MAGLKRPLTSISSDRRSRFLTTPLDSILIPTSNIDLSLTRWPIAPSVVNSCLSHPNSLVSGSAGVRWCPGEDRAQERRTFLGVRRGGGGVEGEGVGSPRFLRKESGKNIEGKAVRAVG